MNAARCALVDLEHEVVDGGDVLVLPRDVLHRGPSAVTIFLMCCHASVSLAAAMSTTPGEFAGTRAVPD
jgi:hypothetical protein